LQFVTIGTTLQLSLNGNVLATVTDSAIRNAGSAGTYSTAGSTVWPAHAAPIARSVPTGSFSDKLNLASGALLSSSWDQLTGSFIGSNGVATGQSKSNLATVYGMAPGNVTLTLNVLPLATGASAGVVARYNTLTGDMVFAEIINRHGIAYVEIWRVRNGVRTRMSHASLGHGVLGGLLQLTVSGTQLTLSVNGHVYSQVSNTVVLGTGAIGIMGSKGAGVDNFSAA
jgi:hypothetical protein